MAKENKKFCGFRLGQQHTDFIDQQVSRSRGKFNKTDIVELMLSIGMDHWEESLALLKEKNKPNV